MTAGRTPAPSMVADDLLKLLPAVQQMPPEDGTLQLKECEKNNIKIYTKIIFLAAVFGNW